MEKAKIVAFIVLFFMCVGISYVGKYIDQKKLENYHIVMNTCSSCDYHIPDSLIKRIQSYGDKGAEKKYYELRQQSIDHEHNILSFTWGPVPDTVWWKRKPSFRKKW